MGAKLAGVHWWWKTASHAAELTAGYYNTWFHDGYSDVMTVLAQHQARASFTCVEMRDCEHPPEGACSPQGTFPLVSCCAGPVAHVCVDPKRSEPGGGEVERAGGSGPACGGPAAGAVRGWEVVVVCAGLRSASPACGRPVWDGGKSGSTAAWSTLFGSRLLP